MLLQEILFVTVKMS